MSVGIGIDCTGRDWRSALLGDGIASPITVRLEPPGGGEHRMILCDPHANISSLGVGFPSIVASVGQNWTLYVGRRRCTIEELVRTELQYPHLVANRVGHNGVDHTTIAVPHALSASKREALLSITKELGWSSIELVDAASLASMTCVAEVDKPKTALVIHIGYDAGEFALIRLARGRTRMVDQGIIKGISGETIDARIMELIILGLRGHNVFLGIKNFTSERWLEFQKTAAEAHLAIIRRENAKISLPTTVVNGVKPLRIALSRIALAQNVAPQLEAALEPLAVTLEMNELSVDDIDAVIAAGEAATRFPVANWLAERFGEKLQLADQGTVAAMAAVHALRKPRNGDGAHQPDTDWSFYLLPPETQGGPRTSGKDGAAGSEGEAPTSFVTEVSTGDDEGAPPPPSSTEAARPKPSTAARGDGTEEAVAETKRLLDAGDYRAAERVLSALARRLENDAVKPPPAYSPAERYIAEAVTALERGDVGGAVERSHFAYEFGEVQRSDSRGDDRCPLQGGYDPDGRRDLRDVDPNPDVRVGA